MTTVAVKGLAEAEQWLATFADEVARGALKASLEAAGERLERGIRNEAPVRTGVLRESIKTVISAARVDGAVRGEVKAGGGSAFYAQWVEYGTQAHDIRPRKAQALTIGSLLRWHVRHPGAKARRFMAAAFDATGESAVESFAAELRRQVAQLRVTRGDFGGGRT